MELKNKVVLVTGSSRGIGKAIAMRFASEGSHVIINAAKSVHEARAVLAKLPKARSQRHCFIQADIKVYEQIVEMAELVRQRYGHLDILVNNAGITRFITHKELDRLTLEIFDEIYQTHLRGSFFCVQKMLPLLKKSKEALVVNIASIASITALGSNIAYCAMKSALVNMTKSLARALAPDIRVNAVSPGLTETDLIKEWGDYKKEQIRKTPLGRLGTCDDVAEAVYALAVSLTYTTGENIIIDGGRVLE